MEIDKLKAIVELLEGTDVSRLEWQSGTDRLVIRRGPVGGVSQVVATQHSIAAPVAAAWP